MSTGLRAPGAGACAAALSPLATFHRPPNKTPPIVGITFLMCYYFIRTIVMLRLLKYNRKNWNRCFVCKTIGV